MQNNADRMILAERVAQVADIAVLPVHEKKQHLAGAGTP